MMAKKQLLTVFSKLLLSTCASVEKTHIGQQELLEAITAGNPPVIVDVRSQWEYDAGHVPGAIHVPFWWAFSPAQLQQVKPEEPLVVYCAHGPRAGIAKFALFLSGYDNIRYLEGHMTAWKEAGLPLQTAPPEPAATALQSRDD